MDDRARVAAEVSAALEGLLGGPDGRGGGNEASTARALHGAGIALESADASWAACRRSLHRAPGSARLPASTWVSNRGAWEDTAVGGLVASLAGSGSLAPAHRITLVTVTTKPAAVPDGAGVSVLSATSALYVQVVVADSGNVDEPGVKVVVTAVPQGAVPAPPPVRVTTDIRAGGSVALTPAPLRVRAGTSYVLDVTATSLTAGAAVSVSVPLRVSSTPTTTTTTTAATTTTTASTTTTVRSG
jgi:hypothetical protein